MEIQKKVLELSKLYVVVAESCNFFFLRERTKDLLRSMFQWDMKNKEKSDVITYVENTTTILYHHRKKRKKYRIIHKIPCSMFFGILEERKGSGLWTKGETKQTTNTWRLKSCALIAPIPKRKSLRWKTQEGKEKPTLISDH